MKQNLFPYSNNNKRYHTLDYFYKHRWNTKICKISLNAGFTCPNIDGKCGTGGCIYCSSLGSGDFAGNQSDPLEKQFSDVATIMKKKWENAAYIGYFQAHTNTYAPVNILKEKYECILKQPNVIGLSVATRADSIDEECLQYLEELNKRTYLTIELGLQTIHEKTSTFINRGHDLNCFDECVQKLRQRNIDVVVHIMNGLPYETKEMMLETIKHVNQLDIQGVKIHMLHVLKNTKLGKQYQEHPFPILSKEEYVDIVCDQLELLRPEIVIHRITGDPKKEDLLAPTWLLKKFDVLNSIDKEMAKRNTYQGFRLDRKHELYRLFTEQIKPNELLFCQCNPKTQLTLASLLPQSLIFTEQSLNHSKNLEKQLRHKVSLLYFENADIYLKNTTTWNTFLNQKGIIILSSPIKRNLDFQEYSINNQYLYIKKN